MSHLKQQAQYKQSWQFKYLKRKSSFNNKLAKSHATIPDGTLKESRFLFFKQIRSPFLINKPQKTQARFQVLLCVLPFFLFRPQNTSTFFPNHSFTIPQGKLFFRVNSCNKRTYNEWKKLAFLLDRIDAQMMYKEFCQTIIFLPSNILQVMKDKSCKENSINAKICMI